MEGIATNQSASNPDDYLIQKRMEIMIDMNNKRIAAELTRVGEMIKSLSEELSAVKRRMDNIFLNQKTGLVDDGNQNIKSKKISKEDQEDGKLKPRYGDYKPEDVDINKFFYFGNK